MKTNNFNTILVADDSVEFREAVAESLRLSGHRVLVAEDGLVALRLLEEEHIDLALLDVCMPGLDGSELLARMTYADKQVIHVVLDNFVIHSSKQTKLWLAEFGQKFRLHFLPPYCPDDNRIERKVWREMHANVTVNHRCETMEELMAEVVYYLMSHNRIARFGVRELRTAI